MAQRPLIPDCSGAHRRLSLTAAALVATGLLLAGAAAAEHLVLRDGARIETRGPWQIKGQQVIFTLPNGTLSSLRLEDIDVGASRAAETMQTAGPKAPRPARGASDRPPPVLEITDRDVPRAARLPAAKEQDAGDDDTGALEKAAKASVDGPVQFAANALVVADWETIDSPRGGLEIVGVLANQGSEVVATAEIKLTTDPGDGTERTYTASIANPTLGPGQQSSFRILLPDVVVLDEPVHFDVRGRAVRPRILGPARPSPPADEAGVAPAAEEGGG